MPLECPYSNLDFNGGPSGTEFRLDSMRNAPSMKWVMTGDIDKRPKHEERAALLAIALSGHFHSRVIGGTRPPVRSGRAGRVRPAERDPVRDYHGSVTVEGHRIDYTATAGTLILRNADGKPTGSMFYVAYAKRRGEGRRPRARSPSSTTVVRAPRAYGCIWARSGHDAW